MTFRPLLLCLSIAAAAALFSLTLADEAWAGSASGLVPHGHAAYHGGRVAVGVGVGVPVAPRGRPIGVRGRAIGVRGVRGRRGLVAPCEGHWAVRRERVWIPGVLVGYDVHGCEIFAPGHWAVQRTRVWVPGCAPVRPVVRHPVRVVYPVRPVVAPRVHVGVGFGF